MTTSKQQFHDLSSSFLKAAELLNSQGQFHASYYLAGYAVECALKAYICTLSLKDTFPPKRVEKSHYIHDFVTLIDTANLKRIFDTAKDGDKNLNTAFSIIKDWSPDIRYDEISMDAKKPNDFILATKEFLKWLQTNYS